VRPPKLGPHRADVLTFCAATNGIETSVRATRKDRMIVNTVVNESGIDTSSRTGLEGGLIFSHKHTPQRLNSTNNA
jgi:hypothetical protein